MELPESELFWMYSDKKDDLDVMLRLLFLFDVYHNVVEILDLANRILFNQLLLNCTNIHSFWFLRI